MAMTYSSICKTGDREINEDCVACIICGNRFCFVVADGLGAHSRGDVASRIAIEVFENEFQTAGAGNNAFLSGAFGTAQSQIMSSKQNEGEMKTTCVALSIMGGRFSWGHVGDSRLYYFKKSVIKERTIDHSVPQMLVLSGEIRDEDIRGHPDRGRLLRAMGDAWNSPRYELSKERRLVKGSSFLLCTDGFWEHITNDMIEKTHRQSKDAEQWLAEMLAIVEATGKGSEMDNYSAITVTV